MKGQCKHLEKNPYQVKNSSKGWCYLRQEGCIGYDDCEDCEEKQECDCCKTNHSIGSWFPYFIISLGVLGVILGLLCSLLIMSSAK